MDTRNTYILINSILLAAVLLILLVCFRRHVQNVAQHTRAIQLTYLRFDLIFTVYAILFFVRVLCTEDLSIFEPISQFLFPIGEGIAILSFFNLMLFLVGGTAAAVRIMDGYPKGDQENGVSPDAWLESPNKTRLNGYRRACIQLLVVNPILGGIDGWVVHKEETQTSDNNTYSIIHRVISVFCIIFLVRAVFSLLLTYRALHEHIATSYKLVQKFIVIKVLLLLTTMQWTVANTIVGEWETDQMYVYSTVCMAETLALTIGLSIYFPGNESDKVPRLESDAAPFKPLSIFAFHDLFQNPLNGDGFNYTQAVE